MSISSIFGSPVLLTPKPSTAFYHGNINTRPNSNVTGVGSNGGCGLVIECSSRPKKKATSHHMKTRPRKTQAWDIRRKPTVYPPLPPLPPDWTFVSSGAAQVDIEVSAVESASPSTPALEAPATSG